MKNYIGFQGLRGAYSELAILQHFGPKSEAKLMPLKSFEAVFSALKSGKISDGLLPFENSLAGTIHENYDLIARYPVQIMGETILRVQHCLIAPSHLRLKDIKTVISHPQALAQCSGYLREKKFAVQNYYDTAGAALDLAQGNLDHTAAIASEQAARLYGLHIIARNIADRGENYTRFLHLKKRTQRPMAPSPSPPKIHEQLLSLILVHSGPGFARITPMCGILQSLGIELVHCEARPTKDAAWTYNYYLEVAAGPQHPSWNTALMTLGAMTRFLRVLGTYPSRRFYHPT